MLELTIRLSDEKLERFIARAREHGFNQPDDYLMAMVDDVLEGDGDEAVTQEEFLADFRQAMLEVKHGEVLTRDEFRQTMLSDE